MLRLPLRRKILLITTAGMFLCKIICAKDDFLIAVDVQVRMISPMGDIIYTTSELGGKVYFERSSIAGYSDLNEKNEYSGEEDYRQDLLKVYSENNAELKRKNFSVIKNKETITDVNK